jgi:SAM-dependent methyltransferase
MISEPVAEQVRPDAVAVATGIWLAVEVGEVIDVLFGERRVWSVNPVGHAPGDDGMRWLPWPRVLQERLHGRTRVSIARHLSQEVLFSRDMTFGNSTRPLELVDDDGNWLTVTKWGALVPAFAEASTDDRQALVTTVARLLDAINTGTSVHAFAAYGTLLGAVRSGTLLGHDHDADIGYLSDADDPAALAWESFRLQRFLREDGWTLTRTANGRIVVALDLPSGGHAHIDVFSAHFAGGRFYLERWVSGELERHHLLPLGQVELEGIPVAAPRAPEALLACTYGESWAVPDPSFKYKVPRPVIDHFNRWVGKGGGVSDRRRWDRYHESELSGPRRRDFADWVLQRLSPRTAVLDLGCGTGRDAAAYVEGEHQVLGVDYSPAALDTARSLTPESPGDVAFEALNLLDLRRLLLLASRFRLEHHGDRAVTGRLVLDALPPDVRRHVWWLCRTVLLGTNGSLFLEVRGGDGVPGGHRRGAPWMSVVDAYRILDEVNTHGGRVEEFVEVPPQHSDADDGVAYIGTVRIRASWPTPV